MNKEVCSLCENLLISGQGSDMVLGFETKVSLRLHTDAFFQQYKNGKNKNEIWQKFFLDEESP